MASDDVTNIDDMLRDLGDAADLEGTELGEWWQILVEMRNRVIDFASDRFRKAWEAEVKAEWKRFKAEYEITEEKETVEVKSRRLTSKD